MADEIAIADMTIDMMVKLLIVQIPDRFGDQVCCYVIAGLTGNPKFHIFLTLHKV